MKKLVLVYGFGAQEEAVCRCIESCHLTARPVAAEEAGETIGHLCGMPGYPETKTPPQKPVEAAILLFAHVSRKDLDHVLDSLRQEQLAVNALKAMVTETNTRWTLEALSRELAEEQRTMSALLELKRFRDSLPAPSVLNMRLMAAMMQVDLLLQGGGPVDFSQILQARKNLQDALENQ